MLTPNDKVRAGGNDIIQIEVTRKCDLFTCSNCTRLLPFRNDTLGMSIEAFTAAVDSLIDWPGVVALFGGNPCTHSKFPELCAILAERIPPHRRGLWTNHTRHHGEVAQKTFRHGRLNLNAHASAEAFAEMDRWFPGQVIPGTDKKPAMHSAILVNYRDLGIRDDEWTIARERCDINHKWSAIIQERDGAAVAYFCEVAGAIDGVTGEHNGVPVRPGWWRESIDVYEHQVRNCCDRGCAVPLRLKGHFDRDDIYDVSPSWLKHLENPKGNIGLDLHEQIPEHCEESTDYARLRT